MSTIRTFLGRLWTSSRQDAGFDDMRLSQHIATLANETDQTARALSAWAQQLDGQSRRSAWRVDA